MKKSFICLIVLLIFVTCALLAGCDETPQTPYIPAPGSSTPSKDTTNNTPDAEDTLTKIIMENIDSWKKISDDYTKSYTYDEIYISSMDIYTQKTKGEYYLSAGYIIKKSDNSMLPYYKHFRVTENSFELIKSSENTLATFEDMLVQNYTLLGLQTFYENDDIQSKIEDLVKQCLQKEENHYKELTSYDNGHSFELSSEQETVFHNIYNTAETLKCYILNVGNSSTQLPLTKIEFYILQDQSCDALFWYNESREIGYHISENGYENLSEAEAQRLLNTSDKISLEWNINWSDEKKEYVLKKAIYEIG